MPKLNFNFTSDRPIYLQLVEQLTLYIVSGKLPPGDKLPPIRELALRAKVNPNTIQRALTELEDQRLIYTERTNGKFVTQNIKLITKYREQSAYTITQQYFQTMANLGFDRKTTINYLKKENNHE